MRAATVDLLVAQDEGFVTIGAERLSARRSPLLDSDGASGYVGTNPCLFAFRSDDCRQPLPS
jgi:hypothetical protein